jgi:hypothetical protein
VGVEVIVGVFVSNGLVGSAIVGDATGEGGAVTVAATLVGEGDGWQATSEIANANQKMNSRAMNFITNKSCQQRTIQQSRARTISN